VQRRSVCMTRCARLGPAAHHFFMLASSSGVAFGHLLAQSSSVVLQMIGPLRTLKPPLRLLLLCESGTSLGRPCDGNWRAEAHGSSSTNRAARTIAAPNEIVVVWRVFSALSRPISAVQLGPFPWNRRIAFTARHFGVSDKSVTCTHLSPAPSAMAQPQPVAGDEPVWVKDDDEDLEELVVDLNLDKEAESTARQIDLQVAPGLWW
jgi:hypothetical protein